MKTHKDLDVWKNSISIVKKIYEVTKSFPKEEIYGITNQIRRSAISIPSNIAEGAARNHKKEFIHFLYVSMSSLSELETQLIISYELSFIEESQFNSIINQLNQLRAQLKGLINHLNKK